MSPTANANDPARVRGMWKSWRPYLRQPAIETSRPASEMAAHHGAARHANAQCFAVAQALSRPDKLNDDLTDMLVRFDQFVRFDDRIKGQDPVDLGRNGPSFEKRPHDAVKLAGDIALLLD